MSMQTRDLRCVLCNFIMHNVPCEYAKYPPCQLCHGRLVITWEAGQAPATDVYGSAKFSEATGEWHTSQREKAKRMAEFGYHEAGDKVGGARADHTLKHTAVSAPGLGLRTSTGERR